MSSRLEVEDEEERQQRIGDLLVQLNSSSSSRNTFSTSVPPTFDFGERKTYAVDPPNELLERARDFLSRLKAENDSLTQRMQDNPSSVDIENIDEGIDQYIEMNLGLGVLETRPEHSHTSADSSSHSEGDELDNTSGEDSSSSSSLTNSTSTDSDSDGVSDSDSASSMHIEVIASRPIKPLPRRVAKSGDDMLSEPPCTS